MINNFKLHEAAMLSSEYQMENNFKNKKVCRVLCNMLILVFEKKQFNKKDGIWFIANKN